MRKAIKLAMFVSLASICALWYWPRTHSACAGSSETQGCKLVADALESASKSRPGISRADIEKDFELDGGPTFADKTTYTYRRCHYIKVEVEFQKSDDLHSPGVRPQAEASRVSPPYIAYPVSD